MKQKFGDKQMVIWDGDDSLYHLKVLPNQPKNEKKLQFTGPFNVVCFISIYYIN